MRRPRTNDRRLSLLVRFAVLSAILVALLGAGVGAVLRNSLRARTISGAETTARALTDFAIGPLLRPADLRQDFVPLSPGRVAELDSVLDRVVRSGSQQSATEVVRIKVWNRRHWLVYSDNDKLRGRWFPANAGLNRAFEGKVTSEVTNLRKLEELDDTEFRTLLAVYVPLRFGPSGRLSTSPSDPVVGAFEIYLPYEPVAATIRADNAVLLRTLTLGLVVLYLGLFRLVAAASRRLRRQAAENQHQALHDALTGLPNRVLLRDRIQRSIADSSRTGTATGVLLLDIDGFKELNDALGHQRGDKLLCLIAERLTDRLRANDSMARLGGDEFAVLLHGIANPQDAATVADDLLASLQQPFEIDAVEVDVRSSVGIAVYPDDGDDADDLLRHADVAMYTAKGAHSGIERYSTAEDHYRPERLALAADLRRGMGADELVLFYQPKLDLHTGHITGCEALVRWQHPDKGLLGPGQFLPVVESTELIKPFTLHLLDQAMGDVVRFSAAGLDLKVAVNLAARSLGDTRLPEQVAAITASHGVHPHHLELELTESGVLDNPERARQVLEAITSTGVSIAVDDFGTGYASISYLTQLPISTLKIDQSFVGDLLTNERSSAVVTFTVGLAASMGMRVVAEGVEDEATLHRLVELGVDEAQGYFISRPVPYDAFVEVATETWLLPEPKRRDERIRS